MPRPTNLPMSETPAPVASLAMSRSLDAGVPGLARPPGSAMSGSSTVLVWSLANPTSLSDSGRASIRRVEKMFLTGGEGEESREPRLTTVEDWRFAFQGLHHAARRGDQSRSRRDVPFVFRYQGPGGVGKSGGDTGQLVGDGAHCLDCEASILVGGPLTA